MTVEELRTELESLVSDLSNSGFDNIDSGTVEKLDKFAVSASELGMNEGKRLIENLSGTMQAIRDGKSNADSGTLRLTALGFYVKNFSGSEQTEEL
ncbi:MAG: hypothetical protein FWH19_06245 [Treponema sp.]|nr:hypothetical protein [Treponema sp.]